jgi:hypothetical protein
VGMRVIDRFEMSALRFGRFTPMERARIPTRWQAETPIYYSADFLLGLLFDPENGGSTFL